MECAVNFHFCHFFSVTEEGAAATNEIGWYFFIFFSRYNVSISFLTCTIFYFSFILEKADDVVKGSHLTGYHLFYKNVSVSLTKHIQHGNNIFLRQQLYSIVKIGNPA